VALVNEFAMIFNRLGIDTEAVLEAAGTKWNFLPFRPGLVGGHCIGVDPYYLTHKAQAIGYEPEVILAGRKLNDSMGRYVADRLVEALSQNFDDVKGAKVLIMGLTFQENCPDIRNTRVIDIVSELNAKGCQVDVYDPWVFRDEVEAEFDFAPVEELTTGAYDAIVIAVAHQQFKEMGAKKIRTFGRSAVILYDLKCVFAESESELRL
jgi:UDP-N-acetyl-D-galactosamine dehydrogenase